MPLAYDFVVAGAGLAGACAARRLSAHGKTLVLERSSRSGAGSGAAAGLINPILGLRARPVFRLREALPALEDLIALAGAGHLYRRSPTLRPARDEDQVRSFARTAGELPDHCSWIPESPYGWLRAPLGVLRIEQGGAIDVDALARRLLEPLEVWYETPVLAWTEGDSRVDVHATGLREPIRARFLILALGRGYTGFPELMRLRLHQIKGQTVRLRRPDDYPPGAPHLAGTGYVAFENGTIVCGSTYEHRFADLAPSRRQTESILQKVSRMLPGVRDAQVLEERAGVRVTVPGIRLPMVGPLPGRRRVWIFTGLGAKGLLTAPLAAAELPIYLEDPERIPRETRVRAL